MLNSIINNPGLYILIIALITLCINLYTKIPKTPELTINYNIFHAGLEPTQIIGNDDVSDRVLKETTNAERVLLCNITLRIRNSSTKTAFNVKIENLSKDLKVYQNIDKNLKIEPDNEAILILRHSKLIKGKYKDVGKPEYMYKENIENDLLKLNPIIKLGYENSKGKKFTIDYKYS